MLPDYPDRVIAEHRRRVETAALAGTLLLVVAGAWWLLGSMDSESDSLLRLGPVVLMFSAANISAVDPSLALIAALHPASIST